MPEIDLPGCTPEPLMGYLKALGVFRLVAEQADPDATLCWRNGVAVLGSRFDRDGLAAFFRDEYRPTPIVGPWNGGSGFYDGGTQPLVAIETSTSARLADYRNTIAAVRPAGARRQAERRGQGGTPRPLPGDRAGRRGAVAGRLLRPRRGRPRLLPPARDRGQRRATGLHEQLLPAARRRGPVRTPRPHAATRKRIWTRHCSGTRHGGWSLSGRPRSGSSTPAGLAGRTGCRGTSRPGRGSTRGTSS